MAINFLIPAGKALVAVECEGMLSDCTHCIFFIADKFCRILECKAEQRQDNKNVFFRLIDVSKTKPYKEAKNA